MIRVPVPEMAWTFKSSHPSKASWASPQVRSYPLLRRKTLSVCRSDHRQK